MLYWQFGPYRITAVGLADVAAMLVLMAQVSVASACG